MLAPVAVAGKAVDEPAVGVVKVEQVGIGLALVPLFGHPALGVVAPLGAVGLAVVEVAQVAGGRVGEGVGEDAHLHLVGFAAGGVVGVERYLAHPGWCRPRKTIRYNTIITKHDFQTSYCLMYKQHLGPTGQGHCHTLASYLHSTTALAGGRVINGSRMYHNGVTFFRSTGRT